MAYNKTYSFNFSSTANVKYVLEFYDQEATSAFYNLKGTLGAGAVDISWGSDGNKMYSPIKASTMAIDFMVTDIKAATYIKQLRTDRAERDVYVYLYCTGNTHTIQAGESPIFAGYLLMDLADDPDIPLPYNMRLKAVDGIAALKYYDLIPSGVSQQANNLYDVQNTFIPDSANPAGQYDLFYTFITWLSRILHYTGYATTTKGCKTNAEIQTSCNWFNGDMPNTSGDPLAWSRIKADKFYAVEGETGDLKWKPLTCYDALAAICETWGMRCFAYKNTFYFISINHYTDNNSGTLAAPVNIDYHRYNIDGTAATTASGESLDLKWGRYYIPVGLTQENKKLSGSQYGLLPAFKKTTVDFQGVTNTNYFQAFPLLTSPAPVVGTTSFGERKYTPIAILNCDGSTDQMFYIQIYLNFVNNLPTVSTMQSQYTFRARKVGTTQWKEAWMNYSTPSAPFMDWQDQISVANDYINSSFPYDTFLTPVHQVLTIPQGPSSIDIASDFPYLSLPASIFTAGDWEIQFKTSYYIDSSANYSGHGACSNPNFTGANFSWDVAGITYANSAVTAGVGQSIVSPIVSGSVGAANQTTQITQAGDDTATEEIKNVLWGDNNSIASGSQIQVYDGANWAQSQFSGVWGVNTLSGTENLATLLAQQVFLRQAQNVRKMDTKIAMDLRYNKTDGSGTRPMYGTPFTRWYTPSHLGSGTLSANWIMHTGTFSPISDTWKMKLYEFKTFTASLTTSTTSDGGTNTGGVGDAGNDIPDAIDGAQAQIGNPSQYLIKNLKKANQNKPTPIAIIKTGSYISATSGSYSQTITSLSVSTMPAALLKAGDTIILKTAGSPPSTARTAITVLQTSDITFEVASDQAANATSIAVTSKTIYQNITSGDEIHISQADLVSQYQNKTKGSIGGMPVTATSLGPITYDSTATNKYDIIGVDQDYIKILPRDFMNNDDSAGDMVVFKDAANSGVKVENTGLEMYAFVSIPYGKSATVVTVYGNNTKNVEVYEMDVNATGLGTAIGSGAVGSAFALTETASTATNFLAIKVVVTNVNNLIYGGIVTLIDS